MLAPEDRHELLHAVRFIGEADSTIDFATRTCQELLRLVPGLSSSYWEVNLAASRVAGVVHPDPGRRWFDRYGDVLQQNMHDHPIVRLSEATTKRSLVTWPDHRRGDSFFGSGLYRDYYLPNGIMSQIAVELPAPRGVRVGLVINRDGMGFDRRERALLTELRPHLVNLYRLVSHAEARTHGDAALADDGWSVVLVDDAGTVLESHPVAVAIGVAARVDLRAGARLPDPLWTALSGPHRDPLFRLAPAVPIRFRSEPAPFEVRLLRSSVGPHLLWIREPSRITVKDGVALGLTPRQAQIALLLAEGLTNDQIAARLVISAGTVRKHLEAAFKRLGVSTRAAAVGRLRSIAAGPAVAFD